MYIYRQTKFIHLWLITTTDDLVETLLTILTTTMRLSFLYIKMPSKAILLQQSSLTDDDKMARASHNGNNAAPASGDDKSDAGRTIGTATKQSQTAVAAVAALADKSSTVTTAGKTLTSTSHTVATAKPKLPTKISAGSVVKSARSADSAAKTAAAAPGAAAIATETMAKDAATTSNVAPVNAEVIITSEPKSEQEDDSVTVDGGHTAAVATVATAVNDDANDEIKSSSQIQDDKTVKTDDEADDIKSEAPEIDELKSAADDETPAEAVATSTETTELSQTPEVQQPEQTTTTAAAAISTTDGGDMADTAESDQSLLSSQESAEY